MSGGVTIERWLVGKNDVGVLPAGIQVFSCPGGNCKKGLSFPVEAVVGMWVFYSADDPTRTSVDPSATPNTNNLIMGQYYSRHGNAVITEIMKIAGEKITCDQIISGASSAPIVGRGEVGRATASCVRKNKLYSVKASIESNRTRQELARNKKLEIIGQYDSSVNPSCDDCDDTTACLDVMKGIIDDLNGNKDTGDFPTYVREPIPVKFFLWHQFSSVFCLDGVESSCNGCDSFTGIKGVEIGGVSHVFGTTLNTSTTSHQSQLGELIKNIDCAFEAHTGKAWLGQGTIDGSCVTTSLVINTDLGVNLIKHDGTLINPCDTIDNGAQACAIGWYGELAEENCDCEGKSDNAVTYYPTHVTLTAIDGFIDFTPSIVTEAVLPLNWGVQLWEQMYRAEPKPGYHNTILRTGGEFNGHLGISRVKGVDIKCPDGYCIISFTTAPYGHQPYATGIPGKAYVRTVLALPIGTDNSALLEDLNAIKNVNNCNGVIDFTCAEDAEPGPPSPSVSPSRYATISVSRSITTSITPTRSSSITPSVTATRSITVSVTRSISVSS